jgi:magnesium-transporting ATPase (P-type)
MLLVAKRPFLIPSAYHRVRDTFTSDRKRMEVRARPVGGIQVNKAFTMPMDLNWLKQRSSRSEAVLDGSLYFVRAPKRHLAESMTYILPDGSIERLVDDDRTEVLSQSRRMAAGGLRVGCGVRRQFGSADVCWLVGMEDPPRGVADQSATYELEVSRFDGDGRPKETGLLLSGILGI